MLLADFGDHLMGELLGQIFAPCQHNCAGFILDPCEPSTLDYEAKAIEPSPKSCLGFEAPRRIGRLIHARTRLAAW